MIAAAAAAQILGPPSPSTVTEDFASVALAGSPTTLTAHVSSSASSDKPTGLVTFYAGSSVIATSTLDSTGVATAALTGATIAGSPYSLTAVYGGDPRFQPSSATAQSLTILPAAIGTTTTLTSSSLNANLGQSVTLTADVSAAVTTEGTPTGSVVFFDGTSNLGSAALTDGGATLPVSTLSAGTHALTATYSASGLFARSTSASVQESVTAPAFSVTATPTNLTVQDGSAGSVVLSFTVVGGYTGSVDLVCGTLPAHVACNFSPARVALAGAPANTTLMLSTNAGQTASAGFSESSPHLGGRGFPIFSAMALLPCCGFFLFRKRDQRTRVGFAVPRIPTLLMLLCVCALVFAGCGGANNNAARGTFPVVVTVKPANGPTQTVSLNVTVN